MNLGSIRFGTEILAAAATHHVDPKLLAAVAAQETGGPGATSGKNIVGDAGHGHGIFQIDDRSWGFAKTSSAMDPAKNADFAAGILADNLQRFGGNVKMALSAYNAGSPTAVGTATTWGDGQTLSYADSVMRHYDALGGGTAATAEQLTADGAQNLASVNALSSVYGATVPSASPYATSATNPASALAAPSSSPYGAARSWTQLTSASQQLGAATTSTMADMIDEGDVYSGDGAEDA